MPLFISGSAVIRGDIAWTVLSYALTAYMKQEECGMRAGLSTERWVKEHPLIQTLVALKETAWFNPAVAPVAPVVAAEPVAAPAQSPATGPVDALEIEPVQPEPPTLQTLADADDVPGTPDDGPKS